MEVAPPPNVHAKVGWEAQLETVAEAAAKLPRVTVSGVVPERHPVEEWRDGVLDRPRVYGHGCRGILGQKGARA